MIKTSLVNQKNKKQLAVIEGYTDEECLMIATYGSANGVFKATTNGGIDTQTIAAPNGNDSIVLTDLILTSVKVQNSITTVRFYDGTNAVNIIVADSSNAPITLAIAFQGKWHGWQGARLELLTDTAAQDATVAVGYFKVREDKSLPFDAWDARR